MRIVLLSLLALSVSTASAAPSPCAAAYEQAHAKYFKKIDELEKQEFALRAGGYVLASGIVYCLWRTRSFGLRTGVVLCGGMLGAAIVGSQGYRYRVLWQIQGLQDAYKIYEAYYQINRQNFGDEAVQDLFRVTGTEPSQEQMVANGLKNMLDSGSICKDGVPAVSWDDVVKALTPVKAPAAAN